MIHVITSALSIGMPQNMVTEKYGDGSNVPRRGIIQFGGWGTLLPTLHFVIVQLL
jgi:hypothetical protein